MTAIKWTSASVFTLPDNFEFPPDAHEQVLDQEFTPCNNRQLSSAGWVAPSEYSDSLVYETSGMYLLRLRCEEKILPTHVIADHMDVKIKALEEKLDRKIRGKEKLDIRDTVIMELTPQAFSKYAYTNVLLSPADNLMFVSESGDKAVDRATSLLRESLGSLPVTPLATETKPDSHFKKWLTTGDPKEPLEVGYHCKLEDQEDEGVLTLKHQDLFNGEFTSIYKNRKVKNIALNYGDDHSFTLSDDLVFTAMKFGGLNSDNEDQIDFDAENEFKASVELLGRSMVEVVKYLADEFGGVKDA